MRDTSTDSRFPANAARGATAFTFPASMQALLDADDVRFLLTRTGFAPPPCELARYVGMSRAQAVEALLAGGRREALTPPPDWVDSAPPPRATRSGWSVEARRDDQRERNRRYDALRAWWIQEMLVTPSPLTERMTLFWHGHFVSGQDKVPYPQTMAAQNRLLRREALGNFGTLLHAIAKDPAMLQYLDGAASRKGHPNENFAREVMELMTLGEGHYSQRDVSESARAYTGWGLDPDTLSFVSRPAQHDDGVKSVLGQSGQLDGDAVLDLLLARPETAHFVAAKLWREFVSDTPEPDALDAVAARFRDSGYEIRVALAALLSTDAFWSERSRGVLIKSPAAFVAGTVRLFALRYDDASMFVPVVRQLGENLFNPPNVKGWPGGDAWINSTTLLARKQFVEQMFRSTAAAPPPAPARAAARAGRPALRSGRLAGRIRRRAAGARRPVDGVATSARGAADRARGGDGTRCDGRRISARAADGPGLSVELTNP